MFKFLVFSVVLLLLFCSQSVMLAESTGFSYPVVLNALMASKYEVKPTTDRQRNFLRDYQPEWTSVMASMSNYIESKATNNCAELNEWLEKKGFSIKMHYPPSGYGVASVMDILVDWLEPGVESKLKANNNQTYPAIEIKNNQSLKVYQVKESSYPIITLKTKQGITVHIMETEKSFSDDLELSKEIAKIKSYPRKNSSIFEVRFPMIDLHTEPNVDWVKGCFLGNFQIDEGGMEIIFRMNEKGAHAKAAAAFATKGLSFLYQIDKPFLLWMTAPNESDKAPILILYCDYDSWKKPDKL